MHKKMEVLIVFNICPKRAILEEKKHDQPSLTFFNCLHFILSFSFCLFSPRILAMDERRRNIILLLELYMFLNMIVMDVVELD
jgi:hypothetical protein